MAKTITEISTEKDHGRSFFRKPDWAAFWTACIVSFLVYFYTLAPTVGLEDSGELAVAGDYLGVPHPPGYPIWSMLAWVFARVFAFVTFRGQPNPAWSIGLLSAVFGALAAGITAMLICRSGADMIRESRHAMPNANRSTEDLICWAGGVVSSLLFAFSPVMWSQSVIVEVYSLNAFFLALIFLLSYWWMCRPTDKLLFATAFVFGLGLTNYQVLLLASLALVAVIMLKDIRLFRDFLIVGAPFGATVFLMKTGAVPPIIHPLHTTCYVYVSLNFIWLALAYFILPRGKTVAMTFLLAELGVAFYAYMPIVSDFRNPPMNWGYPRTWEGFKHALTRGQYEKISPTDVFSMQLVRQIGSYLEDIRMQFTVLAAPLALLPFTAWHIKTRRGSLNSMLAAIPLCLLGIVATLTQKFILPDSAALVAFYKFFFLCVIPFVAIGSLVIFVGQAEELMLKLTGRTKAALSERVTIGLIFLGAVALFLFYVMMLFGKVMDVTEPLRKAADASITAQQLKQVIGILLLMIAPAVLIGCAAWLVHGPFRFKMTVGQDSQKWIIATLFGFLAMSIVLIVLANPKGDIQDAFIQRVKFISSHALYAFWIGYGLIFGLALVDAVFRGNAVTKWLSLGTAMVLPLVPIHQNVYNSELVRKFGGAEQNGHDFGWQFGNYQLRGADAITEELAPDEEPLPNPSFPPEMGRDAIFFGGTDPGRFVPTYMIYSGRVREDVYLITQNALADNTYMSVMRDLYGDQIWIPAQPDSARSFQRYVEEVQSGKRPRNAALVIENGRVQVSGALGVMEINGILAQMIFEHNSYKHPFYVEESYVIHWMFPYLVPHGLIMKINGEKTGLSDATVRDDWDFWDWYTRRLVGDRKFIRDVVARKSFSKLRSAIGGQYAFRGMRLEAENAFQEARVLYPLSPEANFRLAQEVYMMQGAFDKAREVIEEFGRQDSGNDKAFEFVKQIENLEGVFQRIGKLEAEMSGGKIEVNQALQLGELYLQAGQMPQFMNLMGNMLNNPDLPPVFMFRIAQLLGQAQRIPEMIQALDKCAAKLPPDAPAEVLLDLSRLYAQANRPDKIKTCLEEYLKRRPTDWKAWLDMASLHLNFNEKDAAARALDQAVRIGGNEAVLLIRQNRRFDPISDMVTSRARNLIGIPGVGPSLFPTLP